MWLITLVMVISFVLIFVFSLLEVVWLTVYDHDVVAHEGKSGGRTSATKAIRQLNDERMIVVGFILFAIHLLTYFTPLVLGRLSIDMDGGINAILAIYAVALFFFGEIVSKNIGYKYAMRSALLSAVPLRLLLWLCFPITWALRLTNRLTGGTERRIYREEDVIATAQAAREHGTLDPEEAGLIQTLIRVGNRKVRELYIPLDKCTAITQRPTRQQLVEAAIRHSHIVVIAEGDPKTVLGIVRRRDLINHLGKSDAPDATIDLAKAGLIHGMVDVPLDMVISEAFHLLRREPHVGEVTEGGQTVGIIRLRAILFRMAGIEGE